MKKAQNNYRLAKIVEAVLGKTLYVEANSSSCLALFEPKAPKDLDRFRSNK